MVNLFTDIAGYPLRFIDIIDLLIVLYLLYRIYRLVKGTVAFTILIGILLLTILWLVVGKLDMRLLSYVLEKFFAYGVLIFIIIFQPEVRSFLVSLGNSTLKGRTTFLNKILGNDFFKDEVANMGGVNHELSEGIHQMAKEKIGALIVLVNDQKLEHLSDGGVALDAIVSNSLLRNIFHNGSPLHDGAIIIDGNRIIAASVILPLSQKSNLSKEMGLRHRAGLGITEQFDATAIIISEETGEVSIAKHGKLHTIENLDNFNTELELLQ